MQLGRYQFRISTAAYDEFNRSTEYKWAAQERVGQHDALQYTGPGADTITLSGVIFTQYAGGDGQLSRMRDTAAEGSPMILVDGRGFVHGRWVIERVEEGQMVFMKAGVPRKQTFNLSLRYYDAGYSF